LVLAIPAKSWGQPIDDNAVNAFRPQKAQHPGQGEPPTPGEEELAKMKKGMEKKANEQRQADLERDTDKLLQLATELKQYVDKSNKNVLSIEVIKKCEEIEKLSRSVKDKMKGSN
jgi:hypothetical protein